MPSRGCCRRHAPHRVTGNVDGVVLGSDGPGDVALDDIHRDEHLAAFGHVDGLLTPPEFDMPRYLEAIATAANGLLVFGSSAAQSGKNLTSRRAVRFQLWTVPKPPPRNSRPDCCQSCPRHRPCVCARDGEWFGHRGEPLARRPFGPAGQRRGRHLQPHRPAATCPPSQPLPRRTG